MKRAAMRFPNPVAKKQQREVSEDGRMSCSNQRDSGFCSNLISPLKSFLDLKRHPECMGLPQSKALTTQASELFRMEDEIRTAWKTLLLSALNDRVLMTEFVTLLRCTTPTAQSKSCFSNLYTASNGFNLNPKRTNDNVVVACTAQFCPEAKVIEVLIPGGQELHKGDMGPIGPKHQHDLQNEEHKLKGDTTTYLKGHSADTQLFFYEMHNTKGTHTSDTCTESMLDDVLSDRPSRERKLADLQKADAQKR
ncbi:hypothetical protein TURU_151205 [Turdus rufiventris]|nr:hypothetical protein TURU_151205 [Turdus rufiventris]